MRSSDLPWAGAPKVVAGGITDVTGHPGHIRSVPTIVFFDHFAPVAQQRTSNPQVRGSNPLGRTGLEVRKPFTIRRFRASSCAELSWHNSSQVISFSLFCALCAHEMRTSSDSPLFGDNYYRMYTDISELIHEMQGLNGFESVGDLHSD